MRVAITGASGNVGTAVLRRLATGPELDALAELDALMDGRLIATVPPPHRCAAAPARAPGWRRCSPAGSPAGSPATVILLTARSLEEGLMATELRLSCPAFSDHDLMPERLSRPGGNVSPPLEWSGVPGGTQELMLLCEDPDAGPEPFLHWLVTGIDPATRTFGEGEAPASGQEWPNGFGSTGWGGPQPPVGDGAHRYFFRLYAMAEPPDLPPRPHAADVRRAAEEHAIAGGNLVGRFAR